MSNGTEETELLSDRERFDMIAISKIAEERIAAGGYVEHDPEAFVDQMLAARAAEIVGRHAP